MTLDDALSSEMVHLSKELKCVGGYFLMQQLFFFFFLLDKQKTAISVLFFRY